MAPLSVVNARSGDECILTIRGEVVLHTVDDLTAPALDSFGDRTIRRVVLDLAGVTFIDSTGLGELVSLRATAADVGAQLVLRNPTERILGLLRLVHMDSTFQIDPPPSPSRD